MLVATACGGGAAAPSPSASVAASPTAETMTQPTKPIEFVISTAPGGGSDIYARAMAGIIEKNKLSPQPVQPVNKEGGSGAVAFTYVYEKKADMHYIMITLNSFFTTIITQKLPYKATDFTPIANMALDPFFLWVNDDSPWKNAGDFVTAAKAGSIRRKSASSSCFEPVPADRGHDEDQGLHVHPADLRRDGRSGSRRPPGWRECHGQQPQRGSALLSGHEQEAPSALRIHAGKPEDRRVHRSCDVCVTGDPDRRLLHHAGDRRGSRTDDGAAGV